MRCVLALIAAAGCGRLGFDARVGSDGDGSVVGDGVNGDGDGAAPVPTYYLISSDGSATTELFTVEVATGTTALVGSFPGNMGLVGGLAYWDANTLYAATNTEILRITLVPFGVTVAKANSEGIWSSLERVPGVTLLVGIDQTGDRIGEFDPNGVALSLVRSLGVDALGGDIVQIGLAYYWWSNNTQELYRVSVASAPVLVGNNNTIPFIAGMVHDDATGRIVMHSGDTDTLYYLSATTFALLGTMPLDRDVQSGDMTRTP